MYYCDKSVRYPPRALIFLHKDPFLLFAINVYVCFGPLKFPEAKQAVIFAHTHKHPTTSPDADYEFFGCSVKNRVDAEYVLLPRAALILFLLHIP